MDPFGKVKEEAIIIIVLIILHYNNQNKCFIYESHNYIPINIIGSV